MQKIPYIIRPATIDDIDEIFIIEKDGSALWKKEYFEWEFKTDFSIIIVAVSDDKIIGFAVAWDIPGELQLNNIAVAKKYRRMGIGSSMINYILDEVKHKKPSKIFLELKENNIEGKNFYKRMQFIETGKRHNYYSDDNAILMEKKLL